MYETPAHPVHPVVLGISVKISMRYSVVGFFKYKLSDAVDRRKITDRRTQEQKLPYDHRVQPDRRLNNISVEWIPISEVNLHPVLREALKTNRNKKKATGTRKE